MKNFLKLQSHCVRSLGKKVTTHKFILRHNLLKLFLHVPIQIPVGYWADYIDPCSGLPMLTEGCNKVFSEVDCMEVVLGYKSMNCGCCKVLLHPRWGSFVYPATIMTTAPTEALLNLVNPLCK